MSSSDDTVDDFRYQTSHDRRAALAQARRMAVTLTSSSIWQVTGHLLLDNRTPETRQPDAYNGIGFYARPHQGSQAEAIVLFIGGPENPVVVATRDEALRAAVADLDEDETAMFNRSTIVLCKKDGTVEIRSPSGTAHKLVTVEQHNDLVDKLAALTLPVSGATAGPPALGTFSHAAGTQVLKGE